MRKAIGVVVVAVVVMTCSWILAQQTPPAATTPPAEPKSRLVMGFENEDELSGVEISGKGTHEYIKDKKYVTQGEAALKIKVVKDAEGGESLEFDPPSRGKYLTGWEKFDVLKIDIYNLSDKDQTISFRFDDAQSKGVATRVGLEKTLRPGANTVKISLKGMSRENGDDFDIAGLRRFVPFFWNPTEDFEVVFDNMRLEKE
jgi:hypothetical protein